MEHANILTVAKLDVDANTLTHPLTELR
jgi:hypothetical protein